MVYDVPPSATGAWTIIMIIKITEIKKKEEKEDRNMSFVIFISAFIVRPQIIIYEGINRILSCQCHFVINIIFPWKIWPVLFALKLTQTLLK